MGRPPSAARRLEIRRTEMVHLKLYNLDRERGTLSIWQVEDVCRKAGISEATYYLWKRQYSGVGASELRELRQLRKRMGD